jgi:hypothetical protein
MGDRYYDLYDVIEALDQYREANDARYRDYADTRKAFERMHAAQQQFVRAITYLIHEEEEGDE